MSHGLSLLRAIIDASARTEFSDVLRQPGLFLEIEVPAFQYMARHYRVHGSLPSTTAMMEGGFILPPVDNPISYYIEKCIQRSMYNSVTSYQTELNQAMQARNMVRVAEIVTAQARAVTSVQSQRDVESLQQLITEVMEDYEHAHSNPGMQGSTLGWYRMDQLTGGVEGGDVVTFAARPGMGKAQPIEEPVLLASGEFCPMGSLKVGDRLAAVDQGQSVVMAIHPRGELQTYEVEFEDGRVTEVCADHLWSVTSCRWQGEEIIDTSELAKRQTGRCENRMYIPLSDGYSGHKRAEENPWIIGMIIGDGNATSRDVTVTMADEGSVTRMRHLMPIGYEVKPSNNLYGYRLTHGIKGKPNRFMAFLRQYNLACGAKTKRLPDVVFQWTREDRFDLLAGLMDSDGWVEKNGAAVVGFTNRGLCEDVVRLVRSLGGIASIHPADRGDNFRVGVSLPTAPFYLSRKASEYRCRTRFPASGLRVVGVREKRQTECQCITVSHPRSLYVTRDYIVTHNSWLLSHIANRAWEAGTSVLLVSMEMTGKQLARRILGLRAGINPDHIRRGQLSAWTHGMVYQQLEHINTGVPFHILSGSFDKSVPIVDAAIQELSPGLVCIDASYLLDPADKGKGKKLFENLTDVAKEIKTMAMSRNKGIIQTVQFNRDATKAKTRGTEHIGGSDAVGQITTIGVSIKEGEKPNQKCRRHLDIFKNREGEDSAGFDINFLFDPPDFSYVPGEGEDSNGVRITNDDDGEDNRGVVNHDADIVRGL